MVPGGSVRSVPPLGKHAAVDLPAGCRDDHERLDAHESPDLGLRLRRRLGLRRRHGATDERAADHLDVRSRFCVDLGPAHHLYRLGAANLKRRNEGQ
jgi:hypothetical protein